MRRRSRQTDVSAEKTGKDPEDFPTAHFELLSTDKLSGKEVTPKNMF